MPKTNISDKNERNQLNAILWQQPWYQEWFASQGIDKGGKVKLSDQQRKQLQALVVQNGFLDPSDGHIDPAGNVSDFHGWKGLPTAAKIAIIGAAAAGTAGAMGAFGGGGGIAGSAGGGASSAVAPSTGIAGLNTATLTGIPGVTTGVGGGLTGAGTAGLAGTAAIAPEVGIAGLNTSTLTGIPGVSTGTGAGVTGAGNAGRSIIQRLMDGKNGQSLADIGSLFERFGNDEAAKRMSDFNMQDRYNQDALAAQQDRRAQEADAMRKIQQAGYIKSGGAPFDASKIQLSGGRSLPSFNFPRAPITDEAKQAAGMLEQTMLERLGPNGSFTPKPVEDFQRRGVGEQIGRWGGIGTTALNTGKTIWDMFT